MTGSDEPEIIRRLRGIRKIVINRCHGGFGLSHEAVVKYHEIQGQKIHWDPTQSEHTRIYYTDPEDPQGSQWLDRDIDRDDPYLVKVVEELGGENAGDRMSELKVIEIPESVDWVIQEYDGMEWVAEKHRTWW